MSNNKHFLKRIERKNNYLLLLINSKNKDPILLKI